MNSGPYLGSGMAVGEKKGKAGSSQWIPDHDFVRTKIPDHEIPDHVWRGFYDKVGTSDSKTNTTSVFISSMAMIFIFGFAKKYLHEKT